MDLSHFGLRQRPFRSTSDLSCYYPATGHEHALEMLYQGLRDEEGILLLTGTPGCGKTLLCQCLLERLGEAVRTAFLTNTHFADRHSLLQAICYDLELPHTGSEQELRLTLSSACLASFAEGKPTVLIVDEAHHLASDMLEELRLLANLEGEQGRAVQVVLVGQSSILDTLDRPGLAALRQRLAVRCVLPAFTVSEAADYLLHQVRVAGGKAEFLLPQETLEILARSTYGLPRLLNQAAHRAFSLACSAGSTVVDVEAAMEALSVLGLEVSDENTDEQDVEEVHEEEADDEATEESQPLWQSVLSLNGQPRPDDRGGKPGTFRTA